MGTQFDDNLASFLSHSVKVYRSSTYTVNEWGEAVPTSLTEESAINMRIEPARSKHLTTMLQGKEVVITDKAFAKSTEDILVNDTIKVVGEDTEYLVALIQPFYDKDALDHFEMWLKRIDNL